MEKNVHKKGKAFDLVFNIVIITILSIYTLFMLFLLLWGFNTSLKSAIDFSVCNNILGLPDPEYSADQILFGNYKLVFENFRVSKDTAFLFAGREILHSTDNGVLQMLINTVVYVVIGAFLPTITCYVTAYLCAKYKFKFSKFVYILAVIMLSVPTFGSQPSMISMLRTLGIYDTYFVHVFQKLSFGGMYFFVFFAFFETLPDAYVEAAEMDGASQLRVFINIILPLGIKFIGTVALIHGVQYWNDYQAPLLYTPTLPTLSYGVYHLVNEPGNGTLKNTPASVAACMMLAIPTLALFVAFRKKFMGNLTMGGLKG